MAGSAKLDALHTSLERASDQLGDITPIVMSTLYACRADAHERFEDLAAGNRAQLEGEMVEQVLYCLMEWFTSPGEIEILLLSTIPHHIDTLGVGPGLFNDLISIVCETVIATIPASAEDERRVWTELEGELLAISETGASYARSVNG
jgi:hypothetical protein